MTIVEFFDENDIENIASALLCKPDRIVFVGHSSRKMNKAKEDYQEVLDKRDIKTKLEVKSVGRNNFKRIVEVLSEIAAEDEDCHFDLEGGEELYLVAVGMIAERFGNKIGLHRYNIVSNNFLDCDEDGRPYCEEKVDLTIKENIQIYGGKVTSSETSAKTEEDITDLKKMWEVCRVNPSMFNSQINALSLAAKHFIKEGSLKITIDRSIAKNILERQGESFVYVPQIFSSLVKEGLITSLKTDDDTISFEYKSEYVRHLLNKAGNTLEHYITYIASTIKDADGKPTYNDILTGVSIDWDGETEQGKVDVENEVDVVLMHAMVPVFISCKNGSVDSDELYKLSQVAERFGGKYARKALIVSELDKMGGSAQYIRERADEMGIKLIANAADKDVSEDDLRKTIRAFWNS